uniref:Uncharacterized protein n=1 Tax=Romanomermis culicivorax TaxID=13658 RepID=A0A915JHZ6_ROMCU
MKITQATVTGIIIHPKKVAPKNFLRSKNPIMNNSNRILIKIHKLKMKTLTPGTKFLTVKSTKKMATNGEPRLPISHSQPLGPAAYQLPTDL